MANIPLFLILCAYVALQLFRYALDYANIRHMRRHAGEVPKEFEGVMDPHAFTRIEAYLIEKTRFGIVTSLLSSIATVAFLFTGLLDLYNAWVASLALPFAVAGWLFFLCLYLAGELLSIPFSLYFIFRIENRYGFNTMTLRLWAADFVKSLLIQLFLFTLVVFVGLWLVSYSPRLWWLWVWCFFLGFTLFITYISPYVIEPLFNKFTPLDDVTLREDIVRLAGKAGINVGKVLKMDASKRSRHTNAYFTGLGRTKRIILFDTLLQAMGQEEILAVLAHEIGHWKGWHIVKGLAVAEAVSLLLLYGAYRLLQADVLAFLFGLHGEAFFARVLLTGFLAGMLLFLLKPAMNALSRRFEREADRYSCDLGGKAEPMVRALVQLSKENLSNLHPHPLYAVFNYSHPPVLERIKEIRDYCGRLSS